MITIEVSGKKFSGWESIEINKQIDTLCGTFSFITSNKDISSFPIKQNDECKIFIEDEAIITGFVEKFNISYDSSGGTSDHSITIAGRDRTADLADSTIGNTVTITTKTSLIDIAEKVLKDINATDIKVTSDVDIDDFNKNENIDAKIGTNAYQFIKEYALQRQVLALTDESGNLLFTRASKNAITTQLVNIRNGLQNNILSAQLMTDYSQRFYKYNFKSSGNPSAALVEWDGVPFSNAKQISNISDTATDDKIRTSRTLNRKQHKTTDQATIKNRAEWEKRIRQVNSFRYSVTVPTFIVSKDGIIWKPNLLVSIKDELIGIDGDYLTNSVSYRFDNQGGSNCTISFVDKNAYDIQLKIESSESEQNAAWR